MVATLVRHMLALAQHEAPSEQASLLQQLLALLVQIGILQKCGAFPLTQYQDVHANCACPFRWLSFGPYSHRPFLHFLDGPDAENSKTIA